MRVLQKYGAGPAVVTQWCAIGAAQRQSCSAGMAEEAHQDAASANGLGLPDFEDDEDPDELLSDEDAPDLQDEVAKTLTSLKVCQLMSCVAPSTTSPQYCDSHEGTHGQLADSACGL